MRYQMAIHQSRFTSRMMQNLTRLQLPRLNQPQKPNLCHACPHQHARPLQTHSLRHLHLHLPMYLDNLPRHHFPSHPQDAHRLLRGRLGSVHKGFCICLRHLDLYLVNVLILCHTPPLRLQWLGLNSLCNRTILADTASKVSEEHRFPIYITRPFRETFSNPRILYKTVQSMTSQYTHTLHSPCS